MQVYASKFIEFGDLSSGAVFIGGFTSTIISSLFLSCMDPNDAMTIPILCAVRHLIDIPSLALIFL